MKTLKKMIKMSGLLFLLTCFNLSFATIDLKSFSVPTSSLVKPQFIQLAACSKCTAGQENKES